MMLQQACVHRHPLHRLQHQSHRIASDWNSIGRRDTFGRKKQENGSGVWNAAAMDVAMEKSCTLKLVAVAPNILTLSTWTVAAKCKSSLMGRACVWSAHLRIFDCTAATKMIQSNGGLPREVILTATSLRLAREPTQTIVSPSAIIQKPTKRLNSSHVLWPGLLIRLSGTDTEERNWSSHFLCILP